MSNCQKSLSIEQCIDILDWFSDEYYDYVYHNYMAKIDGDERIKRVLPELSDHCMELVRRHRDSENAYPEEKLVAA